MIQKQCRYCNKEFKTNNKSQILCSVKCRATEWERAHPDKRKQYNKKSTLSRVILCKECGVNISPERRRSGVTLCSDSCARARRNRLNRNYKKDLNEAFSAFKAHIGCAICTYNQYGGSLDFHHINPKEKTLRITATKLSAKNPRLVEELDNCVLLCKNCHHEMHEILRRDADDYMRIIANLKRPEFLLLAQSYFQSNGDVY